MSSNMDMAPYKVCCLIERQTGRKTTRQAPPSVSSKRMEPESGSWGFLTILWLLTDRLTGWLPFCLAWLSEWLMCLVSFLIVHPSTLVIVFLYLPASSLDVFLFLPVICPSYLPLLFRESKRRWYLWFRIWLENPYLRPSMGACPFFWWRSGVEDSRIDLTYSRRNVMTRSG